MKRNSRKKRHLRIRKYLAGTSDRPRLSVFRASRHIYGQIIDDAGGKTLLAVSDIKLKKGTKSQRAFEVGKKLAESAIKHKIKQVVFDRGGFLYHGRVEKFAKGAREGGLIF